MNRRVPFVLNDAGARARAATRLWELQPYTVANALAEKSVSGITFTDVAGGIQIDIDSGVAAQTVPRDGAALIWTLRDSLRGTAINWENFDVGGYHGMMRHRLDGITVPTGQEVDLLVGTCDALTLGRFVGGGIRAQATPACVAWRSSASSPAIDTEYLDGSPGAGLVRAYVDYSRLALASGRAGIRDITVSGDNTEDPKVFETTGPSWTEGSVSLGPYRYLALVVRVDALTTAPVSYVVRPLTIAQDDS